MCETESLNGESFNFGPNPGSVYTVVDILNELSSHWKTKHLSEFYKITNNVKFHEAGLLKLNCDKALFHLKWMPTLDYKKLVEYTGSWYFNFYRKKDMTFYTLNQIKNYEQMALNKEINGQIKA